MNPILGAGVTIGLLCGAWIFVMGFTGLYKDPATMAKVFIAGVVVVEIAGLMWGLRKTAAEGRTYLGQIVAGTLMAVVAGVIIVCASLVFTMVAFPDYFAMREAAERRILQAEGRSEAQISATLRETQASVTPMSEAMDGFIGTLVTGILASAAIASVVRSKPPVTHART
jgi:hypothetical protein